MRDLHTKNIKQLLISQIIIVKVVRTLSRVLLVTWLKESVFTINVSLNYYFKTICYLSWRTYIYEIVQNYFETG